MNVQALTNHNRIISSSLGNFSVLEHVRDLSVAPQNAQTKYFMSEMGIHKRQVVIELNGKNGAILQAGAMQWTLGHIQIGTGIKGAGDLLGKFVKSKVTNETTIKPEYTGEGLIVLEPTYKYIILVDVSQWNTTGGMVIEDGMFLACDRNIILDVVARSTFSSAIAGGEGLFNTCLRGQGIAALESPVPYDELICINLNNEELKIDGNMAVCWSRSLAFTVEKSSQSVIGSLANKEGLVNVYRGTGQVLLSPVTNTSNMATAALGK